MVNFLGVEIANADIVQVSVLVIAVIIAYVVFNFLLNSIKKNLLKTVKTKKQKSTVEILIKSVKYATAALLVFFGILYYSGSVEGIGLTIGLFTAALGFALQKPITGVAGWLMVVTRRPFEIGDRIIIGNIRGDVTDITLTHILLNEAGGTVSTEENSGRILMVPNSILFEQTITNYTLQDDLVLDEVLTSITYESDLDKGMSIAENAAKEVLKKMGIQSGKEPYVRIEFEASGVNVFVRYLVLTTERTKVRSQITKEIFDQVKKEKKVEIAYPHTEIIYRKK